MRLKVLQGFISSEVRAPKRRTGVRISYVARNMQTRAYVTVLAETVQGKGRTLFVRLGVIRTERRGGNVAPKVVLGFGRCEDAAQGSRSTTKKEELWKIQASLAYGGVNGG